MSATTAARGEPLPQPFLDAFPTRPVVVRPGRVPVGSTLWLLTFVGLALVTAVLSWRSLAPDYAMRDDAAVAPAAGVEGSCTISGGLFSLCDVTMTYLIGGEVREVDRLYFWVELETGGDYSEVVVSSDGEHATLGLAQDRLTNRTLTSAGFLLLCLWLVTVGTGHLRRVLRVRRSYGVPGGLTLIPVAAHVYKTTPKSRIGGPTPIFGVEVDGRVHRPVQGLSRDASNVLRTSSGAYVAVVPAVGPGEPVLLDQDFTGLELSEDERSALLGALASS